MYIDIIFSLVLIYVMLTLCFSKFSCTQVFIMPMLTKIYFLGILVWTIYVGTIIRLAKTKTEVTYYVCCCINWYKKTHIMSVLGYIRCNMCLT